MGTMTIIKAGTEKIEKFHFSDCSKRFECKAQEKLKADAYFLYARI